MLFLLVFSESKNSKALEPINVKSFGHVVFASTAELYRISNKVLDTKEKPYSPRKLNAL